MTIREFQSKIELVANEIAATQYKRALLLHHNDTDGICAGLILEHALSRSDCSVSRYCLEKPYPKVVEKLLSDQTLTKDAVIIATDFGSGMLSIFDRANCFSRPIYIFDHHTLESGDSYKVTPLNCIPFNLSGVNECCAAAICAYFAYCIDQRNSDLLKFGVLGAVGDSQLTPEGKFEGFNATLLRLAEETGDIRREGRELYIHCSRWLQAKKLKQWTDALGSVGYLRQGPDVAFKGLYEGFDERYETVASGFLGEFEERRDIFLRQGKINKLESLVWFELGQEFAQMGVKTVGLIAEAVREVSKFNQNYIIGFQKIPAQIPGMGAVAPREDKVSLRVGAELWEEIRVGRKPGLDRILESIGQNLGAFVDACHPHAAAITLPEGKRTEFIDVMNGYIEKWQP